MKLIRFSKTSGFTLIELSIVLVIIGLVAGSILVGQEMIKAAEARGQITQIERYRSAVNVFKEKYGYLPGDIPATPAARFGFTARGLYAGEGDGNGLLEGVYTDAVGDNRGSDVGVGETVVFFRDLSDAKLIDGSFPYAAENNMGAYCCVVTPTSNPSLSLWLPDAKLGGGNSISVGSQNGKNYYTLSSVLAIGYGTETANPGITVQQAYNIDVKVDDGVPLTGTVTAQYMNVGWVWAGTASSTVAASGSTNTCYDNAGSTSNPVTYSLSQNNGDGVKCAISFRF